MGDERVEAHAVLHAVREVPEEDRAGTAHREVGHRDVAPELRVALRLGGRREERCRGTAKQELCNVI